jgi:thymidylate kinase
MTESETHIVAFEGPPLMGKSTQAGKLHDYLEEEGYEVKVLKRAENYCSSREEINKLREEAKGWTRELERITPEYETELWAEYYQEKTKAVQTVAEDENPDYIIVDRYFLSLIPTQQLALDECVEELVQEYREDIEALNTDIVFLLTTEKEVTDERYLEREEDEIPPELRRDFEEVGKNYQRLSELLDLTEIEAAQSQQEVFEDIKQEMKKENLI